MQILEAALVLLCAAALVRARLAVVVCAVTVVVNGAVVLPSFGGSQPAPAKGSATLTIGHLNAQSGAIDVAHFRAYLTASRPALFVLLDPEASTVTALERNAAGYQVWPVGIPGSDYVWAVALARVPLRGVRHPADRDLPNGSLECVVDLGSSPISLLFLHTESPFTPGRASHRDAALAAAARWSRAQPYEHVVEGDLNATPWSAAFDSLVHGGRLHSSLVGFGVQASWPAAFWPLRVPIDHALLSAHLTTVDRGTGPSFGSQHRSLHLTIALRG